MAYAITDEDFDALVRESNATSPVISPVDVALVLFEESAGFNPASPGPAAAKPPVGGLNQMSTPNLAGLGLTRAAWLTMSAAEQLPYIFRWWTSIGRQFNGGDFPADAATLLALNYLPGSYAKVGAKTNPDAAISGAAGPYSALYHDNPALDPHKTGKISVNTIGAYLNNVAAGGGARWAQIQTGIHDALARAGGGGGGGGNAPSPPGGLTLPTVNIVGSGPTRFGVALVGLAGILAALFLASRK